MVTKQCLTTTVCYSYKVKDANVFDSSHYFILDSSILSFGHIW
jgi:hypothetical protein